MRSLRTLTLVAVVAFLLRVIAAPAWAQAAATSVGIFEGHSDVGSVLHASATVLDVSRKQTGALLTMRYGHTAGLICTT